MATAAEQDFTQALVGKFSACATELLPWEAGKQYQIGDAVIYFPVAGASGGFANNPYFVATAANINSPPRWDNPELVCWVASADHPGDMGRYRTSTIPLMGQIDGTSIAKGYIISDPIPVIVPVGGYLTLYEWGRDAGGGISYPACHGPALPSAGYAVRGTAASNTDITDTTLIPSGQASGNTINNYWRQPALVLESLSARGPAPSSLATDCKWRPRQCRGYRADHYVGRLRLCGRGHRDDLQHRCIGRGCSRGCVPGFIVDTVGAGAPSPQPAASSRADTPTPPPRPDRQCRAARRRSCQSPDRGPAPLRL
jgi:hypothetical protein